jgi:predicted homoserine dehydrogenase-like protein
MSMALKLAALADAEKPVRVGLIGADKSGSMFLSQAPRTRGCTSLGSPTSTSIASANSPKGSGGLKSAPRPNH